MVGSVHASGQDLPLRGERIYHGKENLKARIAGHQEWLSPAASRCINCHAAQRLPNTSVRSAPVLNRSWLAEVRTRRGGPAYAYDRPSFCNTLRTGVDPSYVMLGRVMPRFELREDQCAALWAYLMQQDKDESK